MRKVYVEPKFLKMVLKVLTKETSIFDRSCFDYSTLLAFFEAKSKEKDGLVLMVDSWNGFIWDFPSDEDIASIDDNFTLFDFIDYAKELFPVEKDKSDFEDFLVELHGFIGGYLEKIK